MRVDLKVSSFQLLPDGRLRVFTGVEDFKAMLDDHSPNILIDYLNEKWKPGIAPVRGYKKMKKGGNHGSRV